MILHLADLAIARRLHFVEHHALGVFKDVFVLTLKDKTLGKELRTVEDAARFKIQHQDNDDHALIAKNSAFPEHCLLHIPHALAVDQRTFKRDALFTPETLGKERERLAVFQQNDIVLRKPAFPRKFRMFEEMLIFTVDRWEPR